MGGQVSPESQYLELSWAHACPPLQLLAMDPGQLILPPTMPSLSRRQHPCGCWHSLGKDVYGSLTQVLSQQAQSCFGQDWLCLGGLPVRERALGPPNHTPPHSIVGGPASLPLVEVGLEGGISLCSFYRQQNRGQRDVLIQPCCPCLARAGSPLAPPSKLSGHAAQW